jgi:hypothetical protein
LQIVLILFQHHHYQLQSNDLSDDSKTGLMHDQSEDLRNVIQDNNPKINVSMLNVYQKLTRQLVME